jgi:hypothetical protein
MDNSKTLELEILITISQNKNVPTCHFQHLFEHRWKQYHARFSELISEGVFNAATPITGMPYYELTSKGKTRITELIEQREAEVSERLLQLQQPGPSATPYWKTVKARIQSAVHMWTSPEKATGKERRSDYDNVKDWLIRTRPMAHKVPHKAQRNVFNV